MASSRADFFRIPLAELGPDALVLRFLSEFEGASELEPRSGVFVGEVAEPRHPRSESPRPSRAGVAGSGAPRPQPAGAAAAIVDSRLSSGVVLRATERGGRGSLDLLKTNSTERPCGGGWLVSASTGQIVPLKCRTWRCPRCANRLRACAATTIREGVNAPEFEGRRWVFITLTDTADRNLLTLADLGKQWNRTNGALRRELGMRSYAMAVEQQTRGALHPHVLASVTHEVWQLAREPKHKTEGKIRRTRLQYAWHFDRMVPLAERLGWGQMVDVEKVYAAEGAAGYMVKALAGYMSKEGAGLESFAKERLRPFRTSADWPVRFSEVCARRPASDDPGPWQRVEVKT